MGFRKKSQEDQLDPKLPTSTEKVPLVPFKVLETNIPFYTDPDCKEPVEDATIAIIQALDPDDKIQELDIVPTTKQYQEGDYVTLAFNNKKLWEECWFRDRRTREIQPAWNIHVDFIGEVIEPSAIERERERIDELERRVDEQLKARAKSREDKVN